MVAAVASGAGAGLTAIAAGLVAAASAIISEATDDQATKHKLTDQERRRTDRCHDGNWNQPGDNVAGIRSSDGNIIYHPRKPLLDGNGNMALDKNGQPILVASGAEACFPAGGKLTGGTPPNRSYKPPGWVDGVGMDRGHLVASILGGSGRIPENIAPICLNANRGPMRVIEEDIRDRVTDSENSETIYYRVTPHYHPGDPVPYELQLLAVGDRSGVLHKAKIKNPWDGQECGKVP